MLLPGKKIAFWYVNALAEANGLEMPLSQVGFYYHIETSIKIGFQAKENAIRYYEKKTLYDWYQNAVPNHILKKDVSDEDMVDIIERRTQEEKAKHAR